MSTSYLSSAGSGGGGGTPTGPAGTPNPAVVSVQGITGMTPVQTTTTISGTPTVDVGNFPATQPVSGTVAVSNFPATQGVSGTVTADQGGAWAVSVSNFPATQPVSGTVAVSNFPATQPVSGQVAASGETSTIYEGATALTPQFAVINVSAAGSTTVVAATSGKRVRVLSLTLIAAAATTITWQTSTGPTAISGPMALPANGGYSAAYAPVGLFQSNTGDALELNLSAAAAVGGHLVYVLA